MHTRWRLPLALAVLFIVSAGLMISAMQQETATVDETVFLGAGWSYWLGHRYRLNPEHPPLMQLLASSPLKLLDPKLSAFGDALLSGHAMAETSERWDLREGGDVLRTAELFPRGPTFYHYPYNEQSAFGGDFVYGGQNDAERLLFWGRIPEIMLTLLTALIVCQWARCTEGDAAGLLATAMLLLNPVILAYGHIVQSDIGMAMTFPLSVWMFARLLEAQGMRTATFAGLTAGLALATKYTAVILAPTLAVLGMLHCRRHRETQVRLLKWLLIVAAVAWGMILLLYVPHWSPAPPIDAATAAKLAIPHWLIAFRRVLIPAEYFRGLTLTLLHTSKGSDSYLNGEWSRTGWWYYFPLAFAMKTPLPFLVFAGVGLGLAMRRWRELKFAEVAAWVGGAVYLLCAMSSKTDIGIRHILAVYPLISVGAACSFTRWIRQSRTGQQRRPGWLVAALPASALAVVLLAYPQFLSYMNPLAGGTENGYRHLLDSNYDWGQDVIRLKKFLKERGIDRIYLQYFGTQAAIDYYKIPYDFVDSDAAKQIQTGCLVVSAQALMRPEWKWLRDSRKPVARVGYSLFVYEITPPPHPTLPTAPQS